MIHYHGTPITPRSVLETLAGASFCVSFKSPNDCLRCHEIGQSVMLDNGAYSFWRLGGQVDASGFYEWVEPWLECPTSWAVVVDVIDGDENTNRSHTLSCPIPRRKMAPVWHLHESLDYLDELVDGGWNRVCFGSSGQFAEVGSETWHRRVGEAFDRIWDRTPSIHMLRGMQCSQMGYRLLPSIPQTSPATTTPTHDRCRYAIQVGRSATPNQVELSTSV